LFERARRRETKDQKKTDKREGILFLAANMRKVR
jgi:hypothetical protein